MFETEAASQTRLNVEILVAAMCSEFAPTSGFCLTSQNLDRDSLIQCVTGFKGLLQ